MVDLVKARKKAKPKKKAARKKETALPKTGLSDSAPHPKAPPPPVEDAAPPKGESTPVAPEETRPPAAPEDEAPPSEKAAGPVSKYLMFGVGNERYAISIDTIEEIIPYQPLTPVPNVSEALAGIMAMRGRIATVLDARVRLGHPASPPGEATRIIIVHGEESPVGLLVDAVMHVTEVPDARVEDAASLGTGTPEDYVRGLFHHETELCVLLAVQKFIQVNPL